MYWNINSKLCAFRWLFDSGKLDKKFDYFQCIVDPELLPTDAEEMKPMRDGDANDRTYNSTEGGESVVAPVVVSFFTFIDLLWKVDSFW